MMQDYLLNIALFLPFLALALVLALPQNQKKAFKIITILTTFLQLLCTIAIYILFEGSASLQFVTQLSWIQLNLGSMGQISIYYFVGIDALSVSLVLLTGIIMFLGAVASWRIEEKAKGYFALYLLLSTSVLGSFVALDFFLFYLFFEFMLLPMYFLIGIWGGTRKEYASIKFFIYTLVGSILILIVMIALYLSTISPVETNKLARLSDSKNPVEVNEAVQEALAEDKIEASRLVRTFSILDMQDYRNIVPRSLLHRENRTTFWGMSLRSWSFLLLFLGFAIKLPIVPLHTWLPDAHVEAPTAISVVLAGVLLKIGAYGLLRIAYPIFPEAIFFTNLTGTLAVLAIIYGAMNALAQADLKKMIAYASVSHMGFVLLGIASLTSEGWQGAVYQMFSHGILSALLFLLVGVLYDRTHDRVITHYKGLIHPMPYFAFFTSIAFFASLGLPGFSGFIGELFTLIGAFKSPLISDWLAALAAFGIVLGAAYFLWTLQRMFLGKLWLKDKDRWLIQLEDLSAREWFLVSSLSTLTLVLGIFPHFIFEKIGSGMESLLLNIMNLI